MPEPSPIAIVTGAARRVGRAIAEALLADGWQVVAHVRSDGDAVPDAAIQIAADLADPASAERILDAAPGPVRLLVNSAARFAAEPVGSADPTEFAAHMAVNALAPMLLTDALARRHAGGAALIVNLTDAKLAAPNPDYPSYTLSKYALAGLTEMSARALAPRGIRVNAIAPAMLLPSGGMDQQAFDQRHARNPLERGATVDDVVGALRFLITQPAMTGQTLIIDGGQRYWSLPRDIAFMEPQ